MARFILTLNNKVLGSFKVSEGQELAIGRQADNQIVIDNMAVSAHHARVRLENNKLTLTDLGSRNGTLVNNQKISKSILAHQDWVTIGKHILIVDLHESLSLETTMHDLMSKSQAESSDQTMVLDRQSAQTSWVGFDYLSFLSSVRDDFELTGKDVSIGKNPEADIRVTGMFSFLAGTPSATISKKRDDFVLEHIGGKFKTRVNGTAIKTPTQLKHQDVIKVGPVELQIRRVRRPSV
ncbi:MAG: FHA domain-containing protein [Desulfobacteraceae bacterium]|nr:FHA domain-containing protein [Desulfobacteraceae bacterium]